MNIEEKPIPPPCSSELFEHGTPVFRTDTIRSLDLEPWVQKVAALSGQPVDWYFDGGRAIVLAMGDLDKVRAALLELMPEHDALFAEAARNGRGPVSRRQRRTSARCLSVRGRRSACRVAPNGWTERDDQRTATYLASMRAYAGLDAAPGEIAPTGEAERNKFTIEVA